MKKGMLVWMVVVALLVATVVLTNSFGASGEVYAADCTIPASGPWPPCARGGGATASSGCVIPPSGPWPPCARNGGGAAGSGVSGGGCVVPPSGPWPPCARSGGAPSGGASGCLIPTSGPWPPCATGGRNQPAARPQSAETTVTRVLNGTVIHQGRGAKLSTLAVAGLDGKTIANLEVEIDFTFSDDACSAGGSVARGVLGYSLTSPSGTRVDLVNVAQLSGMQPGTRAKIRFADGAPGPIHYITGRFASADPLSWFDGESPNGQWTVTAFKNAWTDAICQHSVALHFTLD